MNVFLFASESETNLWAGIGAGLWAVNRTSDSDMKARVTKSARLAVGSLGLFYCNATHSFTTPFVVFSAPDPERTIKNVWQGEWVLPFRIHPLGNPNRQFHKDRALKELSVLRDATANVTAALNLTGTTVFVPKELPDADWSLLLRELAA